MALSDNWGYEDETRRLMEALQALGALAHHSNATYKNMILKEKREKTLDAINFEFNSWWSDIRPRNWRLVEQDSMPTKLEVERDWENKILRPHGSGPMDYLWQVVRHNHTKAGWDEWGGSGYNNDADPNNNNDSIIVPLRATLGHDDPDQGSSVFVWYGHSSHKSLGGLLLSDIPDTCKQVTGVVILVGCYVGGIFGWPDFLAGVEGKHQGNYSADTDLFPNARVKIGCYSAAGGLAADGAVGGFVGEFARVIQLGMAERSLTWAEAVKRVNNKLGGKQLGNMWLVATGRNKNDEAGLQEEVWDHNKP